MKGFEAKSFKVSFKKNMISEDKFNFTIKSNLHKCQNRDK